MKYNIEFLAIQSDTTQLNFPIYGTRNELDLPGTPLENMTDLEIEHVGHSVTINVSRMHF